MTQREIAIVSLLPLARGVAHRIARRAGLMRDFPELCSDAYLGAIRAVDSYDPSRGGPLEAHADFTIRNTVLNAMRSRDSLPERARRTLRHAAAIRDSYVQEHGAEPSAAELAAQLPGYEAARRRATMWTVRPLEHVFPFIGEPPSLNSAEAAAVRLLETVDVQKAVNALPERLREVVVDHYGEGASLHRIARARSISPQRASQLHRAALARLRSSIANDLRFREARRA